MVSVDLPNVIYARGSLTNNGSPTGAGGDGLHYLPVANTRTQGTLYGLALSDVVGPTMTGPTTYSNKLGHTLNFPLTCDDVHATYEIVPGLDAVRFALSDPYVSPAVNWAGGSTGPGAGTYSVGVRARDGSGNYGPTRTYTFTVAAEVNPVSYFTGGERGGVWDWSDLANLSQTIDGLTPVTAVGQVVRWVRDTSPNANHLHASDNTTANAPTLQQVNGKYVLRFDGNDVLYADTPFYIPGSNTAYTCIAGIKGAAPATAKSILAAASVTNTTPFFVPLQAVGTTANVQQSMRNNGSGGGIFPVLPSILDDTMRVVTSARHSTTGVQRMRDASLRPTDGGAGASYTAATNQSIGTAIDATRMAVGGSAALSPGTNFFTGDLPPLFIINRYLTDDEVMFGEEWTANRAITTALPGQVTNLDGNATGNVGTVTLTAPAGVASTGGGFSGSGAGSPGSVTLTAPSGFAAGAGSAFAFGSPGSVTIVRLEGQATGTVQDTGEPVTVEEAKQQLRIVADSSEDALIRGSVYGAGAD
jgi:hypothetical protein